MLPPVVLAEMAFYRQPRRRRGPFRVAARVLAWLVAVAAVVASGVAGGGYLYAKEDVAEAFAPQRVSVQVAEKQLDVSLPGRPAIALVIGYDRRHGEQGREFRSDTIMLVRADPTARTLSTLSFPRDLVVEVRCPSRRFMGRINEAYWECKEQGTLETVRALTGLPVHYLVTVNFRGFKQIVAKLGGVWMDVDRRYFNDNTGPLGYAAIDLQPGYQKLNGSQALDFVRFRHTDSDHFRLARQQLFVEAFKESITSSIELSSTKLLKIVKVVTGNVEVGQAGGGTLPLPTLLKYALLAYHLPNGHFAQSRIRPDVVSEDAEFRQFAPASEINRAVWDFTHPKVQQVRVRGAKGPKPPSPRNTTVLVLNGNGVQGAAATTSDALRRRGYRTTAPPPGEEANAPRMDYATSIVYFRRGDKLARAAARKLAGTVGTAEVKRLPRTLDYMANGAMVVFIVGQSFDGLQPPPGSQPRRREPPKVAANPAASLPYVREARREGVPFPVLLPHVLERTSLPDREKAVRVYKLAGAHKAVRLVYKTDANEYWGIQMTNWDDPPIVSEPNRHRRIGRRTYALHYAGEDLRVVSFRYRGASYWVVNTLMNSLSERTMLAIARGLKPVRAG
ncbi:MAG: LCP family protein [Thermoleophilia bacterium]|nr:LCP family protein [Thermoleophilia bacterium]